MSSKKIIINLLPYDEKLAGTGYFFVRLFNQLLKIDSINNYELHVSNHIQQFEVFRNFRNVEIIHHKLPNSKIARVLYEQFIFPFKIRGDIFFSPSVAIPFIFNFSAKVYITTIHDLAPFVFEKYKRIQQVYVKLITRICAFKSDIIITVSNNSKADIINYLNVDESKIHVIYNFFVKKNGSINRIKSISPFFVTVSTVQPGKNLIRLIESFKLFLLENPNYKLFVVGNLGWNYDGIVSRVEELEIKDNVSFLGYVSDEEIERLYQSAEALVYVSLYEGFGIPPLEAMNFNCPVVVSEISSLPEVVGEAGIYVNPYDVLDILRGMKEIVSIDINDYVEKAEIQCHKFVGEQEAKKFLDLINIT